MLVKSVLKALPGKLDLQKCESATFFLLVYKLLKVAIMALLSIFVLIHCH